MRGSKIKKNGSIDRVDTKRTQHDFRCLLCSFSIHMVHLRTIGCHPLISILLGRILLVGLLWTIVIHVTFLAAAETLISSVRCTILHRSIVDWILAWCLVAILLLRTLATILLRVRRALTSILLRILRAMRILTLLPLVRRSLVPRLVT
jgi:hypothetical protein